MLDLGAADVNTRRFEKPFARTHSLMSLGCDFMRDFLAALQEMLKGSVGGCGGEYFYSLFPGKSRKQGNPPSTCDCLSAKAAGGQ